MTHRNDARIIKAKFDSKCAETGQVIPKGVNCLYFPLTKKIFALDSNEADQWRMQLQDDDQF